MPGANDKNAKPGAGEGNDQETKDKKAAGEGGEGEGTGGQAGDNDNGGGDEALFTDPEKVKKLVSDLRKENAKARTKNKERDSEFESMRGTIDKLKKALGGDEADDTPPEEKITHLTQSVQAAEGRMAILELALEHGIPSKDVKYLGYLLAEEAGSLEEGEEVSEERILEIVGEVKSRTAPASAAASSTGVKGDQGGKKSPAGNGSGEVTVEQFAAMNMGERSDLFAKNQPLYNKLFAQAAKERLL
jgi:hypothetical protein